MGECMRDKCESGGDRPFKKLQKQWTVGGQTPKKAAKTEKIFL